MGPTVSTETTETPNSIPGDNPDPILGLRCGLEIAPRWGGGGGRLSAPVHNGPGAHPASYTMGTGSFPGVKWQGRGGDNPPTYSAEVKESVQLYFYSPSGP